MNWYWLGTLYLSAFGHVYNVFGRRAAGGEMTEAEADAKLAGVRRTLDAASGGAKPIFGRDVMFTPPGGLPPGGEWRMPVPNPVGPQADEDAGAGWVPPAESAGEHHPLTIADEVVVAAADSGEASKIGPPPPLEDILRLTT